MHFLTAIAAAALVMASSLSKGLSAPAVSVPYLVKDLNMGGTMISGFPTSALCSADAAAPCWHRADVFSGRSTRHHPE